MFCIHYPSIVEDLLTVAGINPLSWMTTVQSESAGGFVLALSRQFAVYRMFLWLVEGPITGRYWSIVYRRGVWNCYHIVTDLQSLKHCASLSARSIQKSVRTWPRVYKNSIDVIPAKRIRVFIIHCILKNIKLVSNSCRPQAELI